jgi:TrbL/VirB6 plasmid conjugal transfer protein
MDGPAYFAVIEQSIRAMLMTKEPEFLRFGASFFRSMAIVVLAWQGIMMMFSSDPLSQKMFTFARTLLFISIGYAMITYYASPIPGFGSSFTNLITDQTGYFAQVLDASAMENIFRDFNSMWNRFIGPGPLAVIGAVIYGVLMIVLNLAKAATLIITGFGMIASAICVLLGPIFVPFFIVPKLDWIFWSWFKAFLQYSFYPVVSYAYMLVMEVFINRTLTSLPDVVYAGQYLTYGIQVIVCSITFIIGVLLIPSLVNSIFSGSSGQSAAEYIPRPSFGGGGGGGAAAAEAAAVV